MVGDRPGHSLIFLITATDEVVYFDMLFPDDNHIIKDESLIGQNDDGKAIVTDDIVVFAREKKQGNLNFGLKGEVYSRLSTGLEYDLHSNTVYDPEIGHRVQALINLGIELQLGGHHVESIEILKQAIDLGAITGTTNMAYSLQKLRRGDEAISSLRQAIKRAPGNLHLLGTLAAAFNETGSYTDAISTSKHAIEMGANNADIHLELASSLAKIGEKDAAIEEYEKVIEIDPINADAYHKLGSLFDLEGELEKAIGNYEKYLEFSGIDDKTGLRSAIKKRLKKLKKIKISK